MSARKSSHRTIFLIVSSGSPLALIASSLRSISKKPVCPMTRSFHPPMVHCNQRVRFAATWREEFFEVPIKRANAGDVSARATETGDKPLLHRIARGHKQDWNRRCCGFCRERRRRPAAGGNDTNATAYQIRRQLRQNIVSS